jgi:uncharacterized cofD-like protein
MTAASPADGRVVAIGGGHGLAATARACRPWADLTVIVSVADDGGSSGRLRQAHPGLPAPGDLRRCLTALADPSRASLAASLERRLDSGDDIGHPPGNLVLAALVAETGDLESAAAVLASALGVAASVLPAAEVAVDLVGRTATGDVIGQVAVEAAGGIEAIKLEPPDPPVPKQALTALAAADLVVLGPGSFFGSVVAPLGAPRLQAAVEASPGRRVLVHNLFSAAPVAQRLATLADHGVGVDVVVVQVGTPVAGLPGTVEVVEADVARPNGLAHDPARLGPVLRDLVPRSGVL